MNNATTPRRMKFTFTKVFVKKTICFEPGDTFADSIEFVSLTNFIEWVRDINAAAAKGKLEYRVEV